MPISEQDLAHLRACVVLAREAFVAGDGPFGTVLVDADGTVLWTGRNHDGSGDETQHPELAVAQWSASLSPEVRAACTVYTSGEHCQMGLGRIVYAVSSERLLAWRQAWGSAQLVVNVLPINAIAPHVPVDGPAPELEEELRTLHRAAWERSQD